MMRFGEIIFGRCLVWRLLVIVIPAFNILMGLSPGFAADVLDDSQSPRKQHSVQLKWAHRETPSKLTASEYLLLKARIDNVEVRLNTAQYVGQSARIYIKLPKQITGYMGTAGFRLTWETKGLFFNGVTSPGGRTLIYDGVIQAPVMTDFFSFSLTVDADKITGTLKHAPIYEIEVD